MLFTKRELPGTARPVKETTLGIQQSVSIRDYNYICNKKVYITTTKKHHGGPSSRFHLTTNTTAIDKCNSPRKLKILEATHIREKKI